MTISDADLARIADGLGPYGNLDNLDNIDAKRLGAIFGDLSIYCKLRSEAMVFRAEGFIDAAIRAENRMDAVYSRLPDPMKW